MTSLGDGDDWLLWNKSMASRERRTTNWNEEKTNLIDQTKRRNRIKSFQSENFIDFFCFYDFVFDEVTRGSQTRVSLVNRTTRSADSEFVAQMFTMTRDGENMLTASAAIDASQAPSFVYSARLRLLWFSPRFRTARAVPSIDEKNIRRRSFISQIRRGTATAPPPKWKSRRSERKRIAHIHIDCYLPNS